MQQYLRTRTETTTKYQGCLCSKDQQANKDHHAAYLSLASRAIVMESSAPGKGCERDSRGHLVAGTLGRLHEFLVRSMSNRRSREDAR